MSGLKSFFFPPQQGCTLFHTHLLGLSDAFSSYEYFSCLWQEIQSVSTSQSLVLLDEVSILLGSDTVGKQLSILVNFSLVYLRGRLVQGPILWRELHSGCHCWNLLLTLALHWQLQRRIMENLKLWNIGTVCKLQIIECKIYRFFLFFSFLSLNSII